MNKRFATLLLFLIIQFTERFNFAAIDYYLLFIQPFKSVNFNDRYYTGAHLKQYLENAHKALKSNNTVEIEKLIKRPRAWIIRTIIDAKINNPEELKNQIAIFNLWIENQTNFSSMIKNHNLALTLIHPEYIGNPVLTATCLKNFKRGQELLQLNPVSFSSNSCSLRYLKVITYSVISQYELEFLLKNNVQIPEEFESLKTVKNARENIKLRELIQRIAATRRHQNKSNLPVVVQKNISDFLQPKIYKNITLQECNDITFLEKHDLAAIASAAEEAKSKRCTIS